MEKYYEYLKWQVPDEDHAFMECDENCMVAEIEKIKYNGGVFSGLAIANAKFKLLTVVFDDLYDKEGEDNIEFSKSFSSELETLQWSFTNIVNGMNINKLGFDQTAVFTPEHEVITKIMCSFVDQEGCGFLKFDQIMSLRCGLEKMNLVELELLDEVISKTIEAMNETDN